MMETLTTICTDIYTYTHITIYTDTHTLGHRRKVYGDFDNDMHRYLYIHTYNDIYRYTYSGPQAQSMMETFTMICCTARVYSDMKMAISTRVRFLTGSDMARAAWCGKKDTGMKGTGCGIGGMGKVNSQKSAP
jgi:hypothetical protein